MRAFRRPWLWLCGWFASMLLAVAVSLAPMPRIALPIDHLDKLEHLLGYAALSAYAAMLFATRRALTMGFAAVLALGATIEGLQALVPWRSADALDMLANALGVALGMLATLAPMRHALQWLDARLALAR